MPSKRRPIWIDCDNAPHVLFFVPIIRNLRERNYPVILTVRDFGQVIPLAKLFNLKYEVIGRHYGKNKLKKAVGLIIRSFQMVPFVHKNRPCLAVSHGSRSQILISQMMRIPFIESHDYEYVSQLPFVRPKFSLVPEVVFNSLENPQGKRIVPYPGIKEDVYVQDFRPDPQTPNLLGIDTGKILVTLRPPATVAHYHVEKSEKLFDAIMKYLTAKEGIQILLLPRTDAQKASLMRQFADEFAQSKLTIPKKVLNGLDIIWYSDLVISAGGTMIREAAALGVPAFSIFGGKIGAVDHHLEATGRLKIIRSEKDIYTELELVKKYQKQSFDTPNKRARDFIVDIISRAAENSQ